MSIQTTDTCGRNDRFNIVEAQYSFHELLIKHGYRGNHLMDILHIHGEFLRRCFTQVTAFIDIDLDQFISTLKKEDIEAMAKDRLCRQISDALFSETTVFIEKTPFHIRSKIELAVMRSNIERTSIAPIPQEFKISNSESK